MFVAWCGAGLTEIAGPEVTISVRSEHFLFITCKHIYIYIRALRSRSLRDGSLPHKGRFATFVRSCSALRASKRPLKISYLKSACLITPFCRWNQVNPSIFEICLLYENNNNKYSYYNFFARNSESVYLFAYINNICK